MDFSYYDNKNNIQKFTLNANTSWKQVKTDNEALNSIFEQVDANHDNIIQEKELNLLSDLLEMAKKLLKGNNGNDTLEAQEINQLNQTMQNARKTNIIDTKETTKPENYQYINIYDFGETYKPVLREDDYSNYDLTKLEPGKYYLKSKEGRPDDNGKIVYKNFDAHKVQAGSGNNVQNWSEGLNRRIDVIRVAADNASTEKIIEELREIGEELGFSVETVYSKDQWVEDYSLRRHDGKVLLHGYTNKDFISDEDVEKVSQQRTDISTIHQGAAAQNGRTETYAKTVPIEEQVNGKSYLEGGNVLNTIRSDGKPGAIIGQESIGYTLAALRQSNPDATEEMAIQAIADDLGLPKDAITFIPQYDFHIDMGYHPMNDGEMAVPDYDAGIAMLENTDIPSMDKAEKDKLIAQLRELKQKTQPITEEAEKKLTDGGYKIVKVPCFSIPNQKRDGAFINYMNGIGGTDKNGSEFFITNKSDYPELDEKMKDFFTEKFGIKKVFFVSTTSHLKLNGGIDCLTQEAPLEQ